MEVAVNSAGNLGRSSYCKSSSYAAAYIFKSVFLQMFFINFKALKLLEIL